MRAIRTISGDAVKTSDVDEPITLVAPDPRWPELYAPEAERVRGAIGDVATRIEHVGSTAVNRLAGKPIVDRALAWARASR